MNLRHEFDIAAFVRIFETHSFFETADFLISDAALHRAACRRRWSQHRQLRQNSILPISLTIDYLDRFTLSAMSVAFEELEEEQESTFLDGGQ